MNAKLLDPAPRPDAEVRALARELNAPFPETDCSCLLQLFARDPETFARFARQESGWQAKALRFFLDRAVVCRELYREANIGDDVFLATFRDITIWAGDCRRRCGFDGVEELEWLLTSLRMELFRLGRLQFQPAESDGEPVLYVHIPADGPLDPDACALSYQAAARFFTCRRFLCHSWLLEPKLRLLLPADSNILRFQSGYRVLELFPKERQAEERIFGYVSDDSSCYPERTSLQRAAKDFLRSDTLGSALGELRNLSV